MVVTTEIAGGQLADLVKQVQAGNEVLLTQGDKPIAKLVSARPAESGCGAPFHVRSLPGHQVVTPVINQAELAEDFFARQ